MPRSPEEIVQVVFGDPSIVPEPMKDSEHARLFSLFTVELPLPAYRGLPPEWHIAVLDPTAKFDEQAAQKQVISEARALVREFPIYKPLVLVSDHATAHLVDEFTTMGRNVFPMDARDLPQGHPSATQPRLAPFVKACQQKLASPAGRIALVCLFPYVRNRPVQGWRFFGRRKQLRDLVYSDENFVIVGARRVGKSSLMQEAARLCHAQGEEVYFINVQHCNTSGDVVHEILRNLSPRDVATAIRRNKFLDESVLSAVLQTLASKSNRVTLFLDELGNVISRLSGEDWPFLGRLREHAQYGKLRVVLSCFQEVFLRQAAEFDGPAANFGTTLRLGMFSASEAEEFVCAPLEFWSPLQPKEKTELLKIVHNHVGHHPFFLQHFCTALFRSLTETDQSVANTAKALVRRELTETFSEPIEEVFYRLGSPLLQYLFLRCCCDAEQSGKGFRTASFTNSWIASILKELGLSATSAETRSLMEGLEIHALCDATDTQRSRQKIAAPLVFEYVRLTEPSIHEFLETLRQDISE